MQVHGAMAGGGPSLCSLFSVGRLFSVGCVGVCVLVLGFLLEEAERTGRLPEWFVDAANSALFGRARHFSLVYRWMFVVPLCVCNVL